MKSIGADQVICDSDAPIADQVRSVTGGDGVRFAMDPVGGETGTQVVESLASGGRAVLFGNLSGQPVTVKPRLMITGSKHVEGFWLADFMKLQSIPKTLRLIRQVRALVRDKVLATDVAATYPLEQVREAVRHAVAPGKGGKVLLRIGNK